MPAELKSKGCAILERAGSHIHLIGVAGSGMSGLARLLLQHGHRVSGSDLSHSAEMDWLETAGLKFFKGHKASHVGDAELVVYSSAIAPQNVEREAGMERHIPVIKRAECLSILAEKKKALVVSGMHGKTTTSSMLAFVLRSAALRPCHYVGAEVPLLGHSANWDEGDYFVIEGDESDGTIELFKPAASIILNVEEEHLDYYRDIGEIMAVFARLIEQTSGPVVYCADDKNAVLLCSHRPGVISYGLSEQAQYQVLEVQLDRFASKFKLMKDDHLLGNLTLNVPGVQNVTNAAGVAALATELGVSWDEIASALADFHGAKRRFEVKYTSDDYMVVDDYAHHPTEIKATLAAAKNSGWNRITALFQPHRYTRTKLLLPEFGTAFRDADRVYFTDIYAASEQPIAGVTGESVADVVKADKHPSVHYEPHLGRLRSLVSRETKPGDLVLTMGAGDIHKVATQLAQELGLFEDLKKQLKAASVLQRQEPLSKHTSMRIGGPADLWFEPTDEEDLALGLRHAYMRGMPVTLIGRGTNLLVRDGGIRGLCIHLGQPHFSRIKVEGDAVIAGAGARLKNIVAEAKKHDLGALEFMEGIPGNLGGALRMNAGAMQGWTMEVIEEVTAMDLQGHIHFHKRGDLEVHYRSVPYFEQNIAVSARLRAKPEAAKNIGEKLKTYSEKRWASQPAAPSAGCIFKNPGPMPAGKLIDELGLKNSTVGKARVSEVHGNFIVNDGGASADEVLELISRIKAKAKQERQIELETEVIILGEP